MKKTYIIPALFVQHVQAEQMIAASITGIGGDSGLEFGEGDVPADADVKSGSSFGESIFD